ncbi:MAG: methyltransferase domain-containing protein [Phycisphaerae bacterium]|nr:methyltransferase domain-containing protein [Phycisphaerae bacterium]
MSHRPPIPAPPDPATPPESRGVVLHKAASVYDWLSPAMMFWREGAINRRAIDALELAPDSRVLDIGCATGRVTRTVAARLDGARGGLAVGLDASPEMIHVARGKAGRRPCRFDLGLAERLPYPDGCFDAAISTLFFHHLCRDDKLAALREIARVLGDAGRFALADVDVPTNWLGRWCAGSGAWLFDQPELRENIRGELPALFGPAGFSRVDRIAHHLGYVTTFLLRR